MDITKSKTGIKQQQAWEQLPIYCWPIRSRLFLSVCQYRAGIRYQYRIGKSLEKATCGHETEQQQHFPVYFNTWSTSLLGLVCWMIYSSQRFSIWFRPQICATESDFPEPLCLHAAKWLESPTSPLWWSDPIFY